MEDIERDFDVNLTDLHFILKIFAFCCGFRNSLLGLSYDVLFLLCKIIYVIAFSTRTRALYGAENLEVDEWKWETGKWMNNNWEVDECKGNGKQQLGSG